MIICEFYEISLYIIAKLHQLCFILQSISLDAAKNLTWNSWIELDVLQPGLHDDGVIIELVGHELL